MGTATGAVIDYLVAQLATPAAAVIADAVIVDSAAPGDTSTSMIYIGRRQPNDMTAATGPRILPVLGSRRIEESLTVPCFIDCRRDGTLQKTSRDAALALYDVVAHLVATDPTLGGALVGGWYAELRDVELQQPEVPQTAATRSVVLFTVSGKSRYTA